jgi:hypothetical protein
MKTSRLLFLAVLGSTWAAWAQAESPNHYQSQTYGFAMEVPTADVPGDRTMVCAYFLLPPGEKFAPNINVNIQPYGGTLKAYDELSRKQLGESGWKITQSQVDEAHGVITYEYEGKHDGRDMHWYAKAFQKGDRVYLVTGIALAVQWKDVSAKLIQSVDSFRFLADRPKG